MGVFKIPDINKMRGESSEEGADPATMEQDKQSGIEKKIFEQIRKNMEEILWQVEVSVVNKETKEKFTLSSWLYNDQASIHLDNIQ